MPARSAHLNALPDTSARWLWRLTLLALVLAPLPLGSNRAWAWMLLAATQFFLFAWYLMRVAPSGNMVRSQTRFVQFVLVAFALLPLLQLLPMPPEIVGVLSPGRLTLLPAAPDGWLALSVDVSLTAEIALRQAGAILAAVMLMHFLQYREARDQLTVWLVFMGVFNGMFALLFYSPEAKGLTGTFVNKNHFAGMLVMVLPFAWLLFWERKREHLSFALLLADRRAMAAAFSVLLLLITLVGSQSRGAWLALAVGLVMALLLNIRGQALLRFALVGVAVVSTLGLLIGVGLESIQQLLGSREHDYQRMLQWEDTIAMVPDFWLLGSGLGTYDLVFTQFKSADLGYFRYDHAHNDYLEFLVTTGGAGLLLLVLALVNGLWRLACLPGKGRSATSLMAFATSWALFSALIHALVDFNWQIPSNFLLLMVLLALPFAMQSGRSRQ